MSKAVAVQIEGKTLLVETDDTITVPAGQVRESARGKRIPESAREMASINDLRQNFADVNDVIVAWCNNLYSAAEKIQTPERFVIEFGVKLAGEAGVPMLTKASGEASFKVTVEWKKGSASV
jgi:hypothetical protein